MSNSASGPAALTGAQASFPQLVIEGGQIPARFFATRRTHNGFTPAAIVTVQGYIHAVDQEFSQNVFPETASAGARLDARDCVVLPGFIDLHIHGAAGHDTMDATPEALLHMARFLVQQGVTGFLPTTMTAPHAATLAALQTVARFVNQPAVNHSPVQLTTLPAHGARVLGVHLEGPYLSPDFPGAQPAAAIRAPDLAEFTAYLDAAPIRLVTLAPELPGADALIHAAQARGIRVALGHSAATYEQARAAFAQGMDQVTHTYNAMTGLHHRAPGSVGAALVDDRVYAQLIADGIHVHPAAMSILARAKGPDKVVLITDAMAATGMGPGRYALGGLPVVVENDECRLESGALAGSILTMDAALRNFMAATALPLETAWISTSYAPACALGLDAHLGAIEPGFAADLVLLDAELRVVATIIGGEVAYLRDPARLRHSPPHSSPRG
ncbi:MAG: N-acetylglucosamine-6-phosphate deacetylase [Litorilinea sp.]